MRCALVAILGVLDEFLQEGGGERLLLAGSARPVQPRIVLDAHRGVAALWRVVPRCPARKGTTHSGFKGLEVREQVQAPRQEVQRNTHMSITKMDQSIMVGFRRGCKDALRLVVSDNWHAVSGGLPVAVLPNDVVRHLQKRRPFSQPLSSGYNNEDIRHLSTWRDEGVLRGVVLGGEGQQWWDRGSRALMPWCLPRYDTLSPPNHGRWFDAGVEGDMLTRRSLCASISSRQMKSRSNRESSESGRLMLRVTLRLWS